MWNASIAMRHGSVPEVVADGRTGFICRSVGEMIASVGKVNQLDRRACRTHVAERFSVERMVDSYEAAYRRVLEAPIAAACRTVEEPLLVATSSSGVGRAALGDFRDLWSMQGRRDGHNA